MTTTVDQLPMPIPTTTRDSEIERFKRSHRVRVPGADTGPGSQPDTDAKICADIVMPLYAAASINNDQTVLESARGPALDQWAEREGVAPRRDAFGASGSIAFAGAPGGATIAADDELTSEAGLRYRVITGQLYLPGDPVTIVGKDTGPSTNLRAGAQLKWTSPRPGSSDYALVTLGGLTGGRDKENDDDFLLRIQHEKQTRAASGNDAEYQLEIENTPDVAVQKSFTVPAASQAGTISWMFTVLPEHAGGSRCPNDAQVSLVEQHLMGEFPGDDGAMAALIADQNTNVVLAVDWSEGAKGWTDLVPWPRYYPKAPPSGPGAVYVQSGATATSFGLATWNNVYTGILQPQPGQTLAFYDQDNFAWVRKRILSVTGTGPWSIVCDTSNNASDTSYVPPIDQRPCPWSDSLSSVLAGLWKAFDALGPGEQVATPYDEGTRQRRQPAAPGAWPYKLTTRQLIENIKPAELGDIDVLEGDGETPAVGSPGLLAYILLLRHVACFPKTI